METEDSEAAPNGSGDFWNAGFYDSRSSALKLRN